MNRQNQSHSKFWQFNVGHLLTIFAMAVGGVGVYTANDARVTKVEANQTIISENLARLSSQVERMDRDGSTAVRSYNVDLINTKTQVQLIGAQLSSMIPKLERMDANLEWVSTAWRRSGLLPEDGKKR